MEIKWTEEDIICGRIVCKPTHQFSERKNPLERGFKPCGWSAKWTYKIGWLAGGNPEQKTDHKLSPEARAEARKDYCAVAMTDGMITSPKTKKEMAAWLNEEKMIPMPQEWFVATVDFLRRINERGNGWS